jgi:hypothetical protein
MTLVFVILMALCLTGVVFFPPQDESAFMTALPLIVNGGCLVACGGCRTTWTRD